jgi:hypothetical protein
MSLEFEEAMIFVRVIRDVETAFGSRAGWCRPRIARATPWPGAACSPPATRRRPVLTQEMLDYIRPGDGIPAHLDRLVLGAATPALCARPTA